MIGPAEVAIFRIPYIFIVLRHLKYQSNKRPADELRKTLFSQEVCQLIIELLCAAVAIDCCLEINQILETQKDRAPT